MTAFPIAASETRFLWILIPLALVFVAVMTLLAVSLSGQRGGAFTSILAGIFFLAALVFVWRSFYAMRIETGVRAPAA